MPYPGFSEHLFFEKNIFPQNILCWVVFEPIKIFALPYMKSASDEEVEKLLEEFSRRISIFVYKVESAGRDFENKNRDESKSFQKLFKFRIH